MKFKTMLLFLAISIVFINLFMYAKEPLQAVDRKEKKHNLSICAIFKNEAKFLKEWIEYHRLAGVDHFYLYDNGSTDRFKEILNPYIKDKVVTLIYWPERADETSEEKAFAWALSTQVPAYENAVKFRALNETTWLVCLGVHEFLVPPNANSLVEVLEKYRDYPGVTLASDFFDSSQGNILPRRKLLVQTLELTKAPWQNPQKSVSKTIFKPALCEGFLWPPYQCLFKDNQMAVIVRKDEMRINYYANRDKSYLYFDSPKSKLYIDNRLLAESATSELLGMDYEIEDQERAIYRFVPALLSKMGFDSSDWGW